jgi:uncharacterized protein
LKTAEKIKIEIQGQTLLLLKEKAMLWEEKNILLIADVHLGKANHFRKAGIPINGQIHKDDYENMNELVNKNNPSQVIILGDLFHSEDCCDWDETMLFFRKLNKSILFIKGNHDFLPPNAYMQNEITIIESELIIEPFIFTHKPIESKDKIGELYNLAGHIHPGIQIKGKGRQNILLPCFKFSEKNGILPAFGRFTGLYKISNLKNDKIFALTGEEVVPLF